MGYTNLEPAIYLHHFWPEPASASPLLLVPRRGEGGFLTLGSRRES